MRTLALLIVSCSVSCCLLTAQSTVTIAGTGSPGFSGDGGPATQAQINNPYGLVTGPDGALYFCEIGNHRVRRLDLKTHTISTAAGSGQKGYSGDGGPALEASLNEPYEVQVRRQRQYVFRRDAEPRGAAGGREDAYHHHRGRYRQPGLRRRRRARQPGATTAAAQHRVRSTGAPDDLRHRQSAHTPRQSANRHDRNLGRHRRAQAHSGWRTHRRNAVERTARDRPRSRTAISTSSCAKATRFTAWTRKAGRIYHVAGTGETGHTGDGGPAKLAKLAGPKGVAWAPDGSLYLADTESHTIRRIDLKTGIITTVVGAGERGDGPDGPASQLPPGPAARHLREQGWYGLCRRQRIAPDSAVDQLSQLEK